MQFSLPKNTDISIQPIKSFTDNYIWMIKKNKDAVVVDPGDAITCIEILQKENISTSSHLNYTQTCRSYRRYKEFTKAYPKC